MQVQVSVGGPDESGDRPVHIHGRPDGTEEWTPHASGSLAVSESRVPEFQLGVWPPQDAVAVDVDGFYESLAGAGFGYGAAFRGVQAAWRDESGVYADLVLPEPGADQVDTFGIHPALLDGALHAAHLLSQGAVQAGESDEPGTRVSPVRGCRSRGRVWSCSRSARPRCGSRSGPTAKASASRPPTAPARRSPSSGR
ncbi:polyketide synthase dehydratase domain-containing protein [Streptomyces zhihengii]